MKEDAKEFIRSNGFDSLIDLVDAGKCPFCQNPVDLDSMTEDAKVEYEVCGICQVCYDEFGKAMTDLVKRGYPPFSTELLKARETMLESINRRRPPG